MCQASCVACLVSCLWWLHLRPFLVSETQKAVTIQLAGPFLWYLIAGQKTFILEVF